MNERDVQAVITRAVDDFQGNLNDLGAAVGMLVLSRRYGWKVMLLIHSPSTVRKYLKILGVQSLRDVAPELGDLSQRSNAWRLVQGTSNFWKVVRGQISGVRSALVDKAQGRGP